MNPVTSLPYSEFCVAQQLARLLPATKGYSVFAPLSRQERGVDLIVTQRHRGRSAVATIQVKSSRTYSPRRLESRKKHKYSYYTWFNNFRCPSEADFFCLIALYPALDAKQKRELGSWWAPVILLFDQVEMRRFLKSVKTKGGTRDRMFGFGFDSPDSVFQTRGDPKKRYYDYSDFLLTHRVPDIKSFLSS